MDWKSILKRYSAILDNKTEARYLEVKSIKVDFSKSDSIEKLWKIHDKSMENPRFEKYPEKNLLDLKIEISDRIIRNCRLCERKCGVDRTKEYGRCKVKESRIASEFLHVGEEYMLIPSYTIFFSGCNFNCVFCQNWDISQFVCGTYIEPEKLAKLIDERSLQGALNVNWVGGDPTPNIPYILKVLKYCNRNIPQIWNSNMYCSVEAMKILDGIVDLYLTDFKYGNNKCAKVLSNVERYLQIVERNHIIAYKHGDLIVRHLVLPNHIDCCTRYVLKWLSENTPNCIVNVMEQYRPEYKANDFEDIDRTLNLSEYKEAIKIAQEYSLNYI